MNFENQNVKRFCRTSCVTNKFHCNFQSNFIQQLIHSSMLQNEDPMQWLIQNFPEVGGASTPKVGVLTHYFEHFVSKTA